MAALVDKLAESIGRAEATATRRRFLEDPRLAGDERAAALAALLACAYPSLAPALRARPEDVVAIAKAGLRPKDARTMRRHASLATEGCDDVDALRTALRRFARREKLRIAARELLPGAANDVDVTARELSDLADVTLELALREALAWADARFGAPLKSDGNRCGFVVMGMGKLGGRELNAGSDVDLILFYETDEGGAREVTLHEYFVRVTQRLTKSIDEPTDEGLVFRVDLRLRPEGSRGPLVNALAAAERYYETWGRTWERAALIRARAVAGDAAFGEEVLAAFAPFVWRREVNPGLADEMASMLFRARAEAHDGALRDLKLGPGGIREAEFFVQTLQLVWGGREPSLRSANTLEALRRLRSRGLVTDRESREIESAYLALRRFEHRVQFATGLQTHTMPEDPDLLGRMARSLGYGGVPEMLRDLEKTKKKVTARFAALSPRAAVVPLALGRLWLALDAGREDDVLAALPPDFPEGVSPDVGRHLLALARRPDAPLGSQTRDRHPEMAEGLVMAIAGAADPEQAARLLAAFFTRILTPSIYVRALAEDTRALLRVVNLLGSSAYLGEAAVSRPGLMDRILFGRALPSEESARTALAEEVAALKADDRADPDEFVGALRRAKGQVVMEVGLADLSGELDTRACTRILSALADATLEQAVGFALREKNLPSHGLAILAMGKLGGRELGYGSDLDIIFVYDEGAFGEGAEAEAQEKFIRAGQRVLLLLSVPHGAGQGYELDTRLRPSGNQGLLVVSHGSFSRYHEGEAADWERQALLKARFAAGDAELGKRVLAIAERAAYERGAPPVEKLHHLRLRMQRELAGERLTGRVRYDLKLGRGGIVDIEFAVQWLQMKYGRDPRVRTTETETAIASLEACGYLDGQHAAIFRDSYRTLRQIELRLRVHHGTGSQWLEEGAPGLVSLARRVGMRDGPRATAAEALLDHYRAITRDVRSSYAAVLGVADDENAGPSGPLSIR